MSTDPSLDPQLIEQTKQHIRALVGEIAQFARAEIGPQEFYAEMLPRVVEALQAIGGVVWTMEEQGRLTLQYQVRLQETHLAEKDKDAQIRHGRLLQKVLQTGEGLLVQPQSGSGEEDGGANPTDCLLVIAPLKTELEVVGVVEIFQRPESGANTQRGYLRFLLQVCELAGDYLKSRQLRQFSDRQVLWTQLEEFTRLVHASLDPRDTAYTIANEGRRLIECDRVSVAIRRGERCTIEAVSGQDMFDKRSNTIRLLAHLASVVVASGEPMWYSGDTSNLAPQVEEAVQEYVDESHSKMVAVIPLAREQHEEKDKDRPDEPTEAPEPVGALIVELIEDNRIPERMRHRVDVVVQHSAAALANSLEHQNLFLMPVWRALGKTRVVFRARHLPKVVAILVAVVALVAALVFVPYEFAPRSEGTLEPVSKREVFARVNGVVEKVLVEHGTEVRKDDVLVRLRNYELQQKHTETAGQRLATEEELRSTQVSMVTSASATPEERMRWASRLPELREKARSLALEEAILREQVKELHVTSPIDGVVTTWKLKDLLETRPVHEGQRLIEVADPGGLWELDLHMPEDRMGHIAQAVNARNAEIRRRLGEVVRQRIREQVPDIADEPLRAEAERQVSELPDDRLRDALLELTAVRDPATGEIVEPGEDMGLDVSYILATDPGRKHYGKVKEIHYYAEVRGEEGNTVRIKVEIDKNDLRPEHVRQGAAVTAKVVCGKRAVGYVFLHDVFTWVRKMWFRWF